MPTTLPAEPALQIGGNTFTLDGETFEMGRDSAALLRHLGEPTETSKKKEDPAYTDRLIGYYTYPDVVVTTSTFLADFSERITYVDFITNRYSFNGITVGDTAEKLTATIPSSSFLGTNRLVAHGGPANWYQQSQTTKCTKWLMFFPDVDTYEFVNDTVVIPPDTKIAHIKLLYIADV